MSVRKAVRDLNHSPKISLAVGISKSIEWLRDVYILRKGLVDLESYPYDSTGDGCS